MKWKPVNLYANLIKNKQGRSIALILSIGGIKVKCIKCGGDEFLIESTVVVTEIYKIFKNGKVARKPLDSYIVNDNLGEEDTILRCVKCKQAYHLGGRYYTLNLVNYNEKELSEDDIYIENHCRLYNTIIVLKQMA